ncbi:uncharacterized protein [Watersipora subatra]|uniref:uncharacterized protein n=1 Tax=Watersipora subatra TaxID=2589382 RepID=UPI00355BF255
MIRPVIINIGLLLFSWVAVISGECPGTILNWVSIPEDQYDRTYSDIYQEDARPLGFKVGIYSYNRGESICVKVSGTSERRVEVKIETEPPAKLCFKAEGSNGDCVTSKTLGRCEKFESQTDNSTTFEFYCTGECSESDVTFWYRFTVCPLVSDYENEQWCQNVDDDYPGTLLVAGQQFYTTTKGSAINDAFLKSFTIALLVVNTILGIGFIHL